MAPELESLGYGALWSSGRFDPGLSPHFEKLLASTDHVPVASGIVSIWAGAPEDIGPAVAALEERFPGRFLLGIGASHGVAVGRLLPPLLEDGGVPRRPRRAADAGARRNGGSWPPSGPACSSWPRPDPPAPIPYFVPVEHTARARDILGPGPLLAPEVAVVLETDPVRARELARGYASTYLGLPNYTQNLRTFGFGDEDIDGGGSDRLIDAVIPWGDAETIAAAVPAHHDAGADHVCLQVVGDRQAFPLQAYRELARDPLRRLSPPRRPPTQAGSGTDPATWRVATLIRLKTLIRPIVTSSDASATSSKWRAASSHTSSGTGSGRSLRRVTDSASASAARSASLKYAVSRHAATAWSRSSLSPSRWAPLVCMSTQTLQPLIWLARSSTSSTRCGGRSPLRGRRRQGQRGLERFGEQQGGIGHAGCHRILLGCHVSAVVDT